MDNNIWNSGLVADRVMEMAGTLKMLPNHHPGRRYRCALPDVLQDPREAYGYTPIEQVRGSPSAASIDRMDEVLMNWMSLLNPGEVKLIWSWALGVPASVVARKLKVHRATVHRRRLAVLRKLTILLNAANVPVREAKDLSK